MRTLVTTLLLIGTVSSCVERSRDLSRSEREQLEQFVSTTAPSPQHPLDIVFEDKVKLLGYDVSAETWQPGATLHITWYWHAQSALEDGWRLFTHLADADDRSRVNEDGNGVVRQLYQPSRWKAGEYIKDRQEITLPQDWGSSAVILYLGFWKDASRLRITRGPHDDEDRARAARITVAATEATAEQAEPAATPVPMLIARRAEGTINLDGKLDDRDWGSVRPSGAFVNTMTGATADFQVLARTLWDDQNLYVGFDVTDTFLKSDYRNHDDHLWEQDCVEIMVDPDGDGRNYFEMQVSPRGVIFDTRYDSRRVPQPIGHADWQSNLRAAVDLRGTLDDEAEDQGYSVEIAIPWSAFNAGTPPATKPNNGDMWRINFYVMDTQPAGQRAAGWSAPRVGDFHVPNRFGRVRFIDPSAPPPAGPTAVEARVAPPLNMPAVTMQLQQRLNQTAMQALAVDNVDRPRPGEPIPSAMAPAPDMAGVMAPAPDMAAAMAPAPMTP